VSAAEAGQDIVFLHAIEAGPASRSYGVQVAKLAGMPAAVLKQARAALEKLEARQREADDQIDLFGSHDGGHGGSQDSQRQGGAMTDESGDELPLDQGVDGSDAGLGENAGQSGRRAQHAAPAAAPDPHHEALLAALTDLQPDSLSPREALDVLYRLKLLASAAT
jgi:DNA mismatch repair protein MutS